MKRTDIHRPSAIAPADYEFVAFEHMKFEDVGSVEVILYYRELIRAHMARTGGNYSGHEHGGNCHVCGAAAIYTVLFYHEPSNTYIRTGQDCAEKMEMSFDREGYSAFRKTLTDAREARAGKRKAEILLSDAGLSEAWAVSIAEPTCEGCKVGSWGHEARCTQRNESIIKDVVSNVIKYGNLSEKQTRFLQSLLAGIAERPAIEQKRAEERAAAQDCPSGRVKITGRILSLKVVESDYGRITKMLVQDDRGFKVYGSRPSFPTNLATMEYDNPERGDKIEFFAALEPSREDVKFGFFKRPTKARVVEWAVKVKYLTQQEREMLVYVFTTPRPDAPGFLISGIIQHSAK